MDRLQTDIAYMGTAFIQASLSKAKRAQVGAVIVKDGIIISTGYNGTPRNTSNCCETDDNHTKDEVIHAELNAVLNMVISGNGTQLKDSTIYITYMPCIKCASLIKQVGISRVVYCLPYRLTEGVEYLEANDVVVDHISHISVSQFLDNITI